MAEPEAPSPPDGGPRPPDRAPENAEEPDPPFPYTSQPGMSQLEGSKRLPPRIVTTTFDT